uniref:Uncharacterized protein n=1 Tax=Anguilla anguilla TaxID=7936 RepID=A0A0E9UU23_ANGAN
MAYALCRPSYWCLTFYTRYYFTGNA